MYSSWPVCDFGDGVVVKLVVRATAQPNPLFRLNKMYLQILGMKEK